MLSRKKQIMKTRNRIQLIGYLANDPNVIPCKNGSTLVMLRVATHRKRKQPDSADMNAHYKTVWHNIKVFDGEVVEDAASFIKGSHVMIEGSLEYSSFIDRKGQMRHFPHIRAYHLTDLDR
jgi:single stranded DNA-binding protein